MRAMTEGDCVAVADACGMWLKEENAALSEIACRLGYEPEAAFSRAFKRFVGISPGAARRREPRALHDAAILPTR